MTWLEWLTELRNTVQKIFSCNLKKKSQHQEKNKITFSLCSGRTPLPLRIHMIPPCAALGTCRVVLNFIYHPSLECTDQKRAALKQGGCVTVLNTSHSPAPPPVPFLKGLNGLLKSRNHPGACPWTARPSHLTRAPDILYP